MTVLAARTGDVVRLEIRIGRRRRNRCARCRHFMSNGERLICGCGAVYRQIAPGNYLLEALS